MQVMFQNPTVQLHLVNSYSQNSSSKILFITPLLLKLASNLNENADKCGSVGYALNSNTIRNPTMYIQVYKKKKNLGYRRLNAKATN